MKHLLLFVLIVVTMSGCGGGDPETTNTDTIKSTQPVECIADPARCK